MLVVEGTRFVRAKQLFFLIKTKCRMCKYKELPSHELESPISVATMAGKALDLSSSCAGGIFSQSFVYVFNAAMKKFCKPSALVAFLYDQANSLHKMYRRWAR